jgi:hypothetical protein
MAKSKKTTCCLALFKVKDYSMPPAPAPSHALSSCAPSLAFLRFCLWCKKLKPALRILMRGNRIFSPNFNMKINNSCGVTRNPVQGPHGHTHEWGHVSPSSTPPHPTPPPGLWDGLFFKAYCPPPSLFLSMESEREKEVAWTSCLKNGTEASRIF